MFSDRTVASGIRFRHHANPTSEKYLIETMGGGVAVFDFDNDGRLDIFLVNSGGLQVTGPKQVTVDRSKPEYFNRLYRNNGDGSFTDVTEKAGISGALTRNYGMGAVTGDYDNDGWVDLYVTNFGENALYRNNGDGTFTDVTRKAGVGGGGWSVSAGFLDYNNDGWLDLFVSRYLDWDFSKHVQCGDPIRVYCAPAHFGPTTNILYRNNGDGTFTDVSEHSGMLKAPGKGMGIALNDYDGDGFPDILVTNDAIAQSLFHNNGDGTFTERGLEAGIAFDENGAAFSGMGADFNDYDNDGRPDIVIVNLARELYALYRNIGKGGFQSVNRQTNLSRISAFRSGWGPRLVDCDHDGWKDLFVSQSHVMDNIELLDARVVYRLPPLLARNVRGKFMDISAQSGPVFEQPMAGRGAAFGDLDNDGDVDVVINVLNDSPRLLYSNASELPARWLEIKTVGTVSNRGGLGATVKVTGASGSQQWGYVTTACTYLSACDPRLHFGLGADEKAASIEVRWPSGITQTLTDVAANQILTVTKPKSEGGRK